MHGKNGTQLNQMQLPNWEHYCSLYHRHHTLTYFKLYHIHSRTYKESISGTEWRPICFHTVKRQTIVCRMSRFHNENTHVMGVLIASPADGSANRIDQQ